MFLLLTSWAGKYQLSQSNMGKSICHVFRLVCLYQQFLSFKMGGEAKDIGKSNAMVRQVYKVLLFYQVFPDLYEPWFRLVTFSTKSSCHKIRHVIPELVLFREKRKLLHEFFKNIKRQLKKPKNIQYYRFVIPEIRNIPEKLLAGCFKL